MNTAAEVKAHDDVSDLGTIFHVDADGAPVRGSSNREITGVKYVFIDGKDFLLTIEENAKMEGYQFTSDTLTGR